MVDPLERPNLPQQRQFMSARDWHQNLMAERRDDPKEWHWMERRFLCFFFTSSCSCYSIWM